MACSKVGPKLEGLLKCAVCKDMVTKPKTLTCFHSFCQTCTSQLTVKEQGNESGINCPLCNTFSAQKHVQTSFLMNELLDMHSRMQIGDSKCQNCVKKDSNWKCIDCKLDLCGECKENHTRIPICRNHRIVERSAVDELVVDSLVFCTIHRDDTIQFNCRDCETPLCIKCKVTKHENHKTETIEDTLQRIVPQIKENASKLDEKITMFEQNGEHVAEKISEIKEAFTKCRNDAKNNLNEVVDKARKQHSDLIKQLDIKEEEELNKLELAQIDAETKKKECKQVSGWVNTSIEAARGVTLMAELQAGLCSKVLNLIKEKPSKPVSVDSPVLKANKGQQEMNDMLGTVSYKKTRVASKQVAIVKKQVESYLELFKGQYHHDGEHFQLEQRATRIDIINGDLWIPIPAMNIIQIMDSSGNVVNKIENNGTTTPRCVRQAPNGDIILASDSGLYVLDGEGKVLTNLSAGNFCDVGICGEKMVAAKHSSFIFQSYSCINSVWVKQADNSTQNCLGHTFNAEDTVMIQNDGHINITLQSTVSGHIWRFLSGQYIGAKKTGYSCPLYISGEDTVKNLLISCYSNSCITSYNPQNQAKSNANITDPGQPFDVVFDDEDNMWVLHFHEGAHRVTKYTKE